MKFFQSFFDKRPSLDEVQFGRFANIQSSAIRDEQWEQALILYRKKDYIAATIQLLKFITNTDQNNVFYSTSQSKLEFEVIQGSRIINGICNEDGISIEAKIAHVAETDDSLFLDLLQANYLALDCKYAIDTDQNVILVYFAKYQETNVYKIYNVLKELAIRADKSDDVWLTKYQSLTSIQTNFIQDISAATKDAKYTFFKEELGRVKEELTVNKGFYDTYPGAAAFIMLDFIYKVDYLIKPESQLMALVDEVYTIFYKSELVDPNEKVRAMADTIDKMSDLTIADLFSEFYNTTYTFAMSNRAVHARLGELINAELPNATWYAEQGYPQVSKAICGYIAGNLLYIYSLPRLDKALLKLYYQVTEHTFFSNFKESVLVSSTGKIKKKDIVKEVKTILNANKEDYVAIAFDIESCDFTSIVAFAQSYLLQLSKMEAIKTEITK